jgi:hypothetical protein
VVNIKVKVRLKQRAEAGSAGECFFASKTAKKRRLNMVFPSLAQQSDDLKALRETEEFCFRQFVKISSS